MSSRACSKICLVNVHPVGNKKESKRMYAILDEQSNLLARTEFFDKFQIKRSSFPYSLKTCWIERDTRTESQWLHCGVTG